MNTATTILEHHNKNLPNYVTTTGSHFMKERGKEEVIKYVTGRLETRSLTNKSRRHGEHRSI